jgi:hypothetical protein
LPVPGVPVMRMLGRFRPARRSGVVCWRVAIVGAAAAGGVSCEMMTGWPLTREGGEA